PRSLGALSVQGAGAKGHRRRRCLPEQSSREQCQSGCRERRSALRQTSAPAQRQAELSGRDRAMNLVCFFIVTVLWIFSVCLHEFGHAIVAYYGGDTSVREKGYLTFNPLKYTHPVYSLLMPVIFMMLGGIGLPGGAVYINDQALRSRQWRTAVSLA